MTLIDLACPSDVGQLMDILSNDLYPDVMAHWPMRFELDSKRMEAWLAEACTQENPTLVIRSNDKVVGIFALGPMKYPWLKETILVEHQLFIQKTHRSPRLFLNVVAQGKIIAGNGLFAMGQMTGMRMKAMDRLYGKLGMIRLGGRFFYAPSQSIPIAPRSKKQFNIRLAKESDLESLKFMIRVMLTKHQETFPFGESMDFPGAYAQITKLVEGPDVVIVAEDTNGLIGFVAFSSINYWFSSDIFYNVNGFYVKPEHRSSTAGRDLLAVAMDIARMNQKPLEMSDTTGYQLNSHDRFFERCGLIRLGGSYLWSAAK